MLSNLDTEIRGVLPHTGEGKYGCDSRAIGSGGTSPEGPDRVARTSVVRANEGSELMRLPPNGTLLLCGEESQCVDIAFSAQEIRASRRNKGRPQHDLSGLEIGGTPSSVRRSRRAPSETSSPGAPSFVTPCRLLPTDDVASSRAAARWPGAAGCTRLLGRRALVPLGHARRPFLATSRSSPR